MKVLHFLDSVNRGGAEVLILDVCRNAAEFGLDITFVTTLGGNMQNEFEKSCADFIKLERRFPIDPFLIKNLRKIIIEKNIKIAHGHQPVEGLHLYLATRGLKNVKLVLSFHGFIADRKNLWTAKYLIPRTDANISVSRGLIKWLNNEKHLPTDNNFKVVYNGVDERRILSNENSLRVELNLNKDSKIFGMIGNFYRDPRKDQITICKALPDIFAEIPDSFCIFVGKIETGAEDKFNECVKFCERENISEKVFFLGERNDVPMILNALDLFIFSSIQEGLGIAATEASLAKVPLLVSDIEPLLEVTGDGKFAEVFPVQNAEILAEKAIKLLKNKNARQILAEKAEKFASQNFGIKAHLLKLKELYESISTDVE